MEQEKTNPEEFKLNQEATIPSIQNIRKLNVKTLSNHIFRLEISPNVN